MDAVRDGLRHLDRTAIEYGLQSDGFGLEHIGQATAIGFDEVRRCTITDTVGIVDTATTYSLTLRDRECLTGMCRYFLCYLVPKAHD